MSIFKDYIDCYNNITQLDLKKVELNYQLGVIKKKADDRNRMNLSNADAAYSLYEEISEVDEKIIELRDNKDALHAKISKFMRDEYNDILIVDEFVFLDDDGKPHKRPIVFMVRSSRSYSTPEAVASGMHRGESFYSCRRGNK
jgi:hypothetical protein